MALRTHRVYAAGAAGLLALTLAGCGSDGEVPSVAFISPTGSPPGSGQ